MADIRKCVRESLLQTAQLQAGDHVIAALSGGADSVCLLALLQREAACMGFTLSAIHVHHGIRGEEADLDVEFCRDLCHSLDIPLAVVRRDVPELARKYGISLEEAGRQARYECYAAEREKYLSHPSDGSSESRRVFAALAHHMDDQAETVILNLCRGTGIRGMSGIPARRDWIIRPLLGCRRRELEEWLTGEGLSWREDATNASDDYTRNKIRHQILPYLQNEINSASVEHIAELAAQAALWDDFLDREAGAWLAAHYPPGTGSGVPLKVPSGTGPGIPFPDLKNGEKPAETGVSRDVERFENAPRDLSPGGNEGEPRDLSPGGEVEELAGLHPALRARILHRMICGAAGTSRDITARHVRAAEELLYRQVGSRIDLPGGITLRRGYTRLFFEKREIDTGENAAQQAEKGEIPGDAAAEQSAEPGDTSGDAAPRLLWRGDDFSVYTEVPGIHPEIRTFPLPEGEKIPEKNYTKWLDCDKINGDVFFRYRKEGDRLPLPGVGTRKLKSFMIDNKIPAEVRDQVILMAEGSTVLWVVGYRLGAGARITAETRRVLEISFPDSLNTD